MRDYNRAAAMVQAVGRQTRFRGGRRQAQAGAPTLIDIEEAPNGMGDGKAAGPAMPRRGPTGRDSTPMRRGG